MRRAGHETHRGTYTIHLHVAEGGPARGILDRWTARHSDYTIGIEAAMDPAWAILDRWNKSRPAS